MNKKDRERKPARKAPFKESKPVILVVTEGAVTEFEYLTGFANPTTGVWRLTESIRRDE